MLATNDMTPVVLFLIIGFLLSLPVTLCLARHHRTERVFSGYKRASNKLFLGGICIIIAFKYLVLANTSVTSRHPVNHVIRVTCTKGILLSWLGLEVSRR